MARTQFARPIALLVGHRLINREWRGAQGLSKAPIRCAGAYLTGEARGSEREQAQVESAPVELARRMTSAREGLTRATDDGRSLQASCTLRPRIGECRSWWTEQVEEEVRGDASRGHGHREVAVEVPELIANPEAQHAGLVAADLGFEMDEGRRREVADIPAAAEEHGRDVEAGATVEQGCKEASDLEKRLAAHHRGSLGEEERRQAGLRHVIASPAAEPVVEGIAAPLLLGAPLEVDIADESGGDCEPRRVSKRLRERLDRPRQRVRIVVQHEQKVVAGLACAQVPPFDPEVPARPQHADPVSAGELLIRPVLDDDHLVDGQLLERVEDDPELLSGASVVRIAVTPVTGRECIPR